MKEKIKFLLLTLILVLVIISFLTKCGYDFRFGKDLYFNGWKYQPICEDCLDPDIFGTCSNENIWWSELEDSEIYKTKCEDDGDSYLFEEGFGTIKKYRCIKLNLGCIQWRMVGR